MIIPNDLVGCSRIYVSGIYQIKNLINEKIYVGSSNNLYRRYSDHVRLLNKNTHFNPKLQASWNKYGEDAFEFSILEYCHPIRLFDLEQLYIDRLHPQFNISMEVGFPNTPKPGTLESALRSQKNLESRKRSGKELSPEYKESKSKTSLSMWSQSGFRDERSKETVELWSNQEYRDKQKHAHRKVNELERIYIRKLKDMGYRICDLSERFNVSRATIDRIILGLH